MFEIVYKKTYCGMLDFVVRTGGKDLKLTYFDSFDPFTDYFRWIEDIIAGKGKCFFQFDPEGLPVIYEYEREVLRIYFWQDTVEEFLVEETVTDNLIVIEFYDSPAKRFAVN